MTQTFDPAVRGYTNALRAFFADFFAKRAVSAYYFRAPEKALFPYIVYELRHIGTLDDNDRSRRYIMEIDAYGAGSGAELDNLLDFLERALGGWIYRGDMFVEARLGYGRIDIEEERDIKRKRILFEVIYWPEEGL